jgi:hypothetical protein
MRNFTTETTIVAIELQQLLTDFAREGDFNNGHNTADFYAEDGILEVGDTHTFHGRLAIRQFYVKRNERVRTEQKGGVRTVRHTFTNVQVLIEDKDHATLNFGSLNYSAGGTPPLTDLVGPTLFSDCRMVLRRDASGQWRITLFRGDAVFIGNDPFLNKTILKGQQ